MKPRTLVVIQARLNSVRLPRKSLLQIGDYKLIEWVILRVLMNFDKTQIVLAIPDTRDNDELVYFKDKFGINLYRGSSDDLIDRFMGATSTLKSGDYIIRVCADNPFVSGNLLETMNKFAIKLGLEFSHTLRLLPDFPHIDGFGGEIFTRKTLEFLDKTVTDPALREHVTLWAYSNDSRIEIRGMKPPKNQKDLRMSLDINTAKNYDLICEVVRRNNINVHSSESYIIECFINH